MPRRDKFLCPGCNVLGYEHATRVCPSCGKDVRMLARIRTLIVSVHPSLARESLPMIVLRMFIRLKKDEPEIVRKAKALFEDAVVDLASEPVQENLF